MIYGDERTAIFTLQRKGHAIRAIARTLGLSKNTVKRILQNGPGEVSPMRRKNAFDKHSDLIRTLFVACEGNRFRVWEKLNERGINLPYSTLTDGFRRWQVAEKKTKLPSGSYTFTPGEEMQTDTSPHWVLIAGKKEKVQCHALWLGYSRMLFAQGYPATDRFHCKVFLTEGLTYYSGTCGICMVDNSNVVIASGTGENAVIAPEMEAFSKRFHFTFKAHALGHANRSAGVERSFWYIERNFYPGRTFESWDDLNRQFRKWCDKINARECRSINGRPIDRFTEELHHMQRLPLHVPEVYLVHSRTVDESAYINVKTNRYSVPANYVGHDVEVHETYREIRVYCRHRLITSHLRELSGRNCVKTLPEHEWSERCKRLHKVKTSEPIAEEVKLRQGPAEFGAMVDALKNKNRGYVVRSIRDLYRMCQEYPEDSVLAVIREALRYNLVDMRRIETMILRHIRGHFFHLPQT